MRISLYYQNMCMWMNLRNMGKKSIDKYLFDNGYQKVAIYGMNGIGECLLSALKKSQLITLCCGIDKNAENFFDEDIPIVNLDNIPDDIDIIIVALTDRYIEIKNSLETKIITAGAIISFEEILYSIQKDGG